MTGVLGEKVLSIGWVLQCSDGYLWWRVCGSDTGALQCLECGNKHWARGVAL